MWLMVQQDKPDDYVKATGRTLTVTYILATVFSYLSLNWRNYVEFDSRYSRPSEVDILKGDASKAKEILKWEPKVDFYTLVMLMVDADMELAKNELIIKGE